MKKFLFKILLISIILGLFFLMNYGINKQYIQSNPYVIKETTLAVGDSHIKSCIDPSLMDNTANIAQPGEITFITYHKIKAINEHHTSNLKRVITSFSQGNLSNLSDEKFHHPDLSSEFIGRVYSLIPLEEMKIMPIDYRVYLKTILQHMMLFPKQKHHSYIGAFNERPTVLSKSTFIPRIQFHYYDENEEVRDFSEISLNYLDSIINYCQHNDIELYVLNTPFHKKYINNIPNEFNDKIKEISNELKEKNVHFIEYNEMEFDDEYFSDYDHVNGKGAKRVTEILIEHMDNDKIDLQF